MYHSITMGEVNTWTDWRLIPNKKPVVNPPKPKYRYVDAGGIDGKIDLSTVVGGRVQHDNRTGTWDFMCSGRYERWTTTYHKIMNAIHGRYLRVVLEDEPTYYYKGRISVSQWKNASRLLSGVTFAYTLEPYKYELTSANEPWLWDPFSFETGIIRQHGNATDPLTVNSDSYALDVTVEPTERPYPIKIHVVSGSDLKVKIGGGSHEYDLAVGLNNMTDLTGYAIERNGMNLKFKGHGSLWVEMQGGWL